MLHSTNTVPGHVYLNTICMVPELIGTYLCDLNACVYLGSG